MRDNRPTLQADKVHWINELRDIHKDKVGFVIGNGWSTTFYDVSKMKQDGILFGCNEGFRKFPLDYLTWQDSRVAPKCMSFKGIKLCAFRNKVSVAHDLNTTYFYTHGKAVSRNPDNVIQLMHSGGLATQIAYVLGCNPIILVGCDCRFFWEAPEDHRSNIFNDKNMRQYKNRSSRNFISQNGKPTLSIFQTFAKKFIYLYKHLKDVEILQMGDWSIMDEIPRIDWESYWSETHPGRASNGRQSGK